MSSSKRVPIPVTGPARIDRKRAPGGAQDAAEPTSIRYTANPSAVRSGKQDSNGLTGACSRPTIATMSGVRRNHMQASPHIRPEKRPM
jgi:hypothetical protein